MTKPFATDSDAPRGRPRGIVVVSDPTAEGVAIVTALRARGYAVVETPLALLEASLLGEPARAVILALDQDGAIDAALRLRALAGGDAPALFGVGDEAHGAELGLDAGSGRALGRPVDLDALLDALALVLAPDDERVRGTTPPPSYVSRPETARPAPEMEPAPVSDYPAASDSLDVASILPGSGDPLDGPMLVHADLSPELEEILAAAASRVAADASPSSAPSVGDGDVVLPADLLAALDEPLEPDDEESGTGSGLVGTGAPVAPGAARGTSSGDGRGTSSDEGRGTSGGETSGGETSGGATGVGALALGTSSTSANTAARASEGDRPAASSEPPTRASVDDPASVAMGFPPRGEPRLPFPEPRDATPAPGTSTGVATRFGTEPPWTARDAAPFTAAAPSGAFASIPERDVLRPRPAVASVPRAPMLPAIPAPPPSPQAAGIVPAGLGAAPTRARIIELPSVLGEGDAVRAVARAIAGRARGSLALASEQGIRRVVLQDGDIVTAGSGSADETLVAFLAARGDLERDTANRLAGRLPPFGRHAGAALIAHGYLGQDDLWPVLRAHAEWVIGRALLEGSGTCELEDEPPGRLRAEPSVFGGATGAEVLVETIRRVIPPEIARARLGGDGARLDDGPSRTLLGECALGPDENEIVRAAKGRTLGEVLASAEPELGSVLYALVSLGVLDTLAPASTDARAGSPSGVDPLDEEAVRARVRARLALVEDGDYFALLGVARAATAYEIRRAYLELRRAFEPSRLLTAQTADLHDDVRLIVEVLDEAYDILKEPHRRDRYRRAIEAGPP